jgi:hypothetical protein
LTSNDNADLAIHRKAITGVYSCCGGFHIDDEAKFKAVDSHTINERTQPYLKRGLTVEHVIVVSKKAVQKGIPQSCLDEAVATAKRHNLTGKPSIGICPPSNYVIHRLHG